jgi:alpha-1,3-glucosyltransferase
MEVTLHTPVREWYSQTPQNNLSYWGLDYPPLTAYQSYLHGLFVSAFEPEAVALGTSHGYETASR